MLSVSSLAEAVPLSTHLHSPAPYLKKRKKVNEDTVEIKRIDCKNQMDLVYVLFFFFAMLGIKPRTSCMPSKHSTTEMHPQLLSGDFNLLVIHNLGKPESILG
jgi:hypothetical protein